jgi:hypothetical protein
MNRALRAMKALNDKIMEKEAEAPQPLDQYHPTDSAVSISMRRKT